MLDVECSTGGSSKSFTQLMNIQHNSNPKLIKSMDLDALTFGIRHFAGNVLYDTSHFIGEDRNN